MKIIKFRKFKKIGVVACLLAALSSLTTACGKKEVSAEDLYVVDYNVHDLLNNEDGVESDYMLATLEVDNDHLCDDDCGIDLINEVLGFNGKYETINLKLTDVNDKDRYICYSYHHFKGTSYIYTYAYNSDGEERSLVSYTDSDFPYPNGASLATYLDYADDLNSVEDDLGALLDGDLPEDVKSLKLEIPIRK